METIKTTVVVAALLGVLYGVYTILNKQPGGPPPEVAAAFEQGLPELNIDAPGFAETNMDMGYAPTPGDASSPGFAMEGGSDGGLSVPPLGFPSPQDSVSTPATAAPAYGSFESGEAGASSPQDYQAPTFEQASADELPEVAPQDQPPPAISPAAPVGPTEPTPSLVVAPTPPLGQASLAPPPALDASADSSPGIQGPPNIDSSPSFDAPPNIDGPPSLSGPPVMEAAPQLGSDPSATVEAPAVAGAEPAPDSPAIDTPNEDTLRPFQRARRTAKAQIDAGQYRQALFTLSLFHNDPDLNEQERLELLDLLDPLAGRVVYSREHLLTSAHVTVQGENIESIAAKYQIPSQLLVNINGIQRPDAMTSGMELKVVPGPFRAEIDTKRGELTLFLQRMYAGRFPISVGDDPTPRPGDYTIKEKAPGQTYYGTGGQSIPAAAATNPYGAHWMNLGGISVHGSPQRPIDVSRGCISLSPRDASDVYNILSVGSKIVVR